MRDYLKNFAALFVAVAFLAVGFGLILAPIIIAIVTKNAWYAFLMLVSLPLGGAVIVTLEERA